MITFNMWVESQNENIWYHGSKTLFTSFKLGKFSPNEQLGFGIHFTKNKSFAVVYATPNGYIYTTNLFPQKILDITKIYSITDPEYIFTKELFKKQRRYQLLINQGQFVIHLDVIHPKKALELLKKYEYDAVLYDAKYGEARIGGMAVKHKSESMTILDPDKIKIIKTEPIKAKDSSSHELA